MSNKSNNSPAQGLSRLSCIATGVISLIVIGIIGFTITFALSATVRDSIEKQLSWIRGTSTPARPDPKSIIEQVQLEGELATVKTQLAKAGLEVRTYFGVMDACQIGARYVARATISAGINLDGLSATDVTVQEADRITIRLPAPRVLDCILDTTQTQRYDDWGRSPLCQIEIESMDRLANYIALNDFRQAAIEDGILETAKKQSASVIRNMFKFAGITAEIEFKDPVASESIPKSCKSAPPDNWTLRDDGTWTR